MRQLLDSFHKAAWKFAFSLTPVMYHSLHIVCNRRSRHSFSRHRAVGSITNWSQRQREVSEDNQQSITFMRSVKNGLNIRYLLFWKAVGVKSTNYCRLRAKAEGPYLWLLSCMLYTYYNIISRLCMSQCIIKNGLLVLFILVLKATNNVD